MSTLAVVSQKGGVGKTTVSLNLSFALARRGWKILLVDTDPMGAIGLSLHGDRTRRAEGLVAYLCGESTFSGAVLETRIPELHILPAGRAAAAPSTDWTSRLNTALFRNLVAEVGRSYDLVIFDTPSGMEGPTRAVLRGAERLLVPIQAEPLALRTVKMVLEAVADARRQGGSPQIAGFVLTMLHPSDEISVATAREAAKLLPAELLFGASVPRDGAFLRASSFGVPVGMLSRRPPAVAAVFDQLAAEVELRLGMKGKDISDDLIHLLD